MLREDDVILSVFSDDIGDDVFERFTGHEGDSSHRSEQHGFFKHVEKVARAQLGLRPIVQTNFPSFLSGNAATTSRTR